MTGLRLFNTRTRRKQEFTPLETGRARVYTCGPTVYAPPHIGNLRSNLFADLLVRALILEDLEVTHVIVAHVHAKKDGFSARERSRGPMPDLTFRSIQMS